MFHLRLFGSPVLERGGSALTGRAVQRHRLALLALLALAPGRRLSRDRLIATLWPERETTNGRNLLKVSTHVLRSELGDDVLFTESDQLRLNEDVIRVDATEFAGALAGLDYRRAVALYDGPFLDGFFLDHSGEFEGWATRERQRLAGEYAGALEMLASAAEAADDHAAAADWWLRLAAHEPLDSRVALRLMHALRASGNVAGALKHATVHETLLREELGIEAPPEIRSAAEQMRAQAIGVSDTPPPETAPDAERAQDEVSPNRGSDTAPHPQVAAEVTAARRRRAPLLAAAVALVFLLSVGAAFAVRSRAAPAAAPSVAVLPFMNLSASPDSAYFGDGLTEQIIATLSRVEGLHVAARTSSFSLRNSEMDVRAIGSTLGVATVLEGSVRREGGRLRVTAQLIDAETGYHLWTEEYDRQPEDVLDVQAEIAAAIAHALRLRLTPASRSAAAPDLAAYDFYLRALYLRNTMRPGQLGQALEFFDSAIARAPTFALAYAGKASVLAPAILFGYERDDAALEELRALVDRALELDPALGEAHASLGIVRLFWDWDWAGAERSLRRAVALNPNDAHAHHHLANYFNAMGMLDEAIAARSRSVELDPLNPRTLAVLAGDYLRQGDHERSLELYERAMKLDPAHPIQLGFGPSQPSGPGGVYQVQSRDAEAVDDYARIAALRGATAAEVDALRQAFERGGWPAFWQVWLEMDRRQTAERPDPLRAAMLLLLSGDTTRAMDSLDRAYAEHNPGLIFLGRGLPTAFDGMESHPRVARVLAAMKLPRS